MSESGTDMRRLIIISVCLTATSFLIASAHSQIPETSTPLKTDFLGDPLPAPALIRLGTNRFTPANCSAIALSADGKIVVSWGHDSIMGWDAEVGRSLWKTPFHDTSRIHTGAAAYGFRGLCRLPVSGQLALPGPPGSVNLLDFQTGMITPIDLGGQDQFRSIDISPDETMIAVGCGKYLLVCDLQGVEKYRIENHPRHSIEKRSNGDRLTFGGEFSYARFSPDGKFLALVNSERPKAFQILNAATGQVQRKIETKGFVIRFCFSGDSQRMYVTEQQIAARAYDVVSGNEIWERLFSVPGQDERYTTDIALSPTGNELAVGTAIGEDERIHLLDPLTGKTKGTLVGHIWKPWSLEYNADGSQMYSAGGDSVIRRWDIAKREQIRIANSERASGVCSMAPDGQSIAFCDDSGKLHIVDVANGKKSRTIEKPGTTFSQVIYSPDCQRLVAGGSSAGDVHVIVWNLTTGEELHHWDWPKGRDVHSTVEALSFSKDANRVVAAVFRQSACYLFDLPSNQQIAKVRHPQVYGLCMRSDGQEFVSAGWDKKIRLWNCETGELVTEHLIDNPNNGDPRMYGALYAPDGRSIAVLRMDAKIGIYSTELELIRNIEMKEGVVYGSFQFSHNGLWIGVGHSSGKGCVYEVSTGEEVWAEAKHDNYLYNVDFSPDDRCLLTGGEDGMCYLWDLANTIERAPVNYTELGRELIGDSPRNAFEAHQQLALNPEAAVTAIQAALEPLFSKGAETTIGKVEKLLGDLDSADLAIRTGTINALIDLGPSAYGAISAATLEPTGSATKLESLRQLQLKIDDVHLRIRRAAMLLAELDTPTAGSLLDELFESSPNLLVKKMVFSARKHRERFLQRFTETKGN